MDTYFELKRDEYFALVEKVFPKIPVEHMAAPEALNNIAIECFVQSWRLRLDLQYTKLFIETKRVLKHLRQEGTVKFRGE